MEGEGGGEKVPWGSSGHCVTAESWAGGAWTACAAAGRSPCAGACHTHGLRAPRRRQKKPTAVVFVPGWRRRGAAAGGERKKRPREARAARARAYSANRYSEEAPMRRTRRHGRVNTN